MTFMHPALKHLQITFTSPEYEALIQKYTRVSFSPPKSAHEYWDRLPEYVIAHCPLFGASFTGSLDTHSLLGRWGTHSDKYKSVYAEKYQHIGCKHFLAVQKFVNLNEIRPIELSYYEGHLDVPFIIDIFVPNDIPSYAVLHSLPICRIEDGAFVPRYAVYMITYYTTEPKTLWNRRLAENAAFGVGDREYHAPFMYTSAEARNNPELWDLRLWVARGKLQWLDPTTSDLALRAGPPQAMPYVDISGYRREFTWRNGKFELGI